jgi:hypothetical protein
VGRRLLPFRKGESSRLARKKGRKLRLSTSSREQPPARVREEEFAKQLRLARYLAGASLPAARALEPVVKSKVPKRERTPAKADSKAKPEPARQKAAKVELVRERRRAGQAGRQKTPTSGPRRSEKGRGSPGR